MAADAVLKKGVKMKTVVLIIAGLGIIAGALVCALRPGASSAPAEANQVAGDMAAPADETAGAEGLAETPASLQPASSQEGSRAPAKLRMDRPAPTSAAPPSLPFQQALGILVSSQAGFAQKQAAWKQVIDAGHLDMLITELEQRATSNPTTPEYPATLGQAYLQKAGTLKDMREQGILGMKADQTFDAALNLDPSNWDAAFWKAAAMSYWPPQLGKGPELIQRLSDLVKLQETQGVQPHFAQTYMLLGEQYQKQGHPDDAKQTWQRGAQLFPQDAMFAEKLAAQTAPEQAAAR
jgi:tetratricopeptide (TPR) repeat protein